MSHWQFHLQTALNLDTSKILSFGTVLTHNLSVSTDHWPAIDDSLLTDAEIDIFIMWRRSENLSLTPSPFLDKSTDALENGKGSYEC